MPIIKSAIKRMHQTAKRRARNLVGKRNLRTAIKAFLGKKDAASLSAAYSALDTATKKSLLSKNAAARKKAQLAKVLKESGGKATTTKKTAARSKSSTTSASKKVATPAKRSSKK